ncbi:MAG: Npt1/Npt2 family nucleotide transporter [Candidatus Cyclobacteriaceae bacterium M2_1C_046]
MYGGLLKALNIQASEASRVFLLLLMGFFIGIFLATLDVGATTIFLQNFSETEDLPLAILLSGIFGLLSTTIYNYFQNKVKFATLGIFTLILILLLLGIIEVGLNSGANQKEFYFLAFIVVVPFNFLVMLLFWGAFNRMFDIRSAKRIIGSVDTGQLLASILALFSIPVLLTLPGVNAITLLTISLFSVVGILLSFFIIGLKRLTSQTSAGVAGKISYNDLIRNKYIFLMALFVIISMIAINFIDYSFLSVVTEQFTENELPTFLSLFEATVVIFSFLFQTFITDKVITLYGLKVSLLINPILVGMLTAAAFLTGSFFGYTTASGAMIFFFMAIAMSKLFVSSLKDALDGPAFKLYFLPIDKRIRFDVQTKIEGVVTALASLIAGGLIILINNVRIFELIHVTIFTLPLIVLWYFITKKMHHGYRDTLQSTLVNNKNENSVDTTREYSVEKVLQKEIAAEADDKVLYSLHLMEKLEPALFENAILSFQNSNSDRLRKYAEDKIRILDINQGTHDTISKLAREAQGNMEDSELISLTPDRLIKLSKSVKSEDRIVAAKLLRKMASQQNIFILLELLRDIDPKIKLEAITTARKVKRPETWPVLIEQLDSPLYSHSAAAALVEAGEATLPVLETAFHRSGQSDQLKIKLVQIMGRIGGLKAMKLLWNKIDYPDKRIVRHILMIYRYMNFQAGENELKNINSLLDMEIGKTLWNISATKEIPETDIFIHLHNALKEEIDGNFDQIYMLLSILYDAPSVQLVRENIESGTSEGVTFALELLDIFISPELKPKLFPLLDDINVEEKLAMLQVYYPREKYTTIQTLNYILNKDYNMINRWTKACAIHAIVFIPEFRISKGLIAQLFNPDQMLQEAAAWAIYNKDELTYNKIAERLEEDKSKLLSESIKNNKVHEGLKDGFFLKVEMVLFLKGLDVFRNIKGHFLCDLVEKMDTFIIQAGDALPVILSGEDEHVYIMAEGEIMAKKGEKEVMKLTTGNILGTLFLKSPLPEVNRLEARQRTIIFTISIYHFYNVLANHHELAQDFLKSINQDIKEEINEL